MRGKNGVDVTGGVPRGAGEVQSLRIMNEFSETAADFSSKLGSKRPFFPKKFRKTRQKQAVNVKIRRGEDIIWDDLAYCYVSFCTSY